MSSLDVSSPRRWSCRAAFTFAVASTVIVTMNLPAHAAVPTRVEDESVKLEELPRMPSVDGESVTPRAPAPRPVAAVRGNPRVTWPTTGAPEVSVPDGVTVEVMDRRAARGGDGPLLRLRDNRSSDNRSSGKPFRVTVDYSGYRHAYGGDWASRFRLVPVSGGTATFVGNDVRKGLLSAEVSVDGPDGEFAVTAAPDGPAGDYKATPLSPSGSWQVSTQSGGFSWEYPLAAPPVPGGLVPELSLSYSSSSVDGRTVSTNNQVSWLGEGWDLWPGYIERSYKGCADDLGGNNGTQKTGDQCWETADPGSTTFLEKATLSFAGISGELVYAGGGRWRPEKDDGTRVEKLANPGNGNGDQTVSNGAVVAEGEYWKVTTTDGTQYFFGTRADSTWTVPVFGNDAGEQCHRSTFATSVCDQAYRWNLDYVVDRHRNTMTYHYAEELNRYGANNGAITRAYTRGGTLARIDYGTRSGGTGYPPARVVFTPGDRCAPGSTCTRSNTSAWPDVPWDQECTAASCTDKWAPTFWSSKRLGSVKTQVSLGSGNYQDVDRWDFSHSFPDTYDGTSASLWLATITHTGVAVSPTPSVVESPVQFAGTRYPNRVDTSIDGAPALNKYRITGVHNETGGVITVNYAPTECVAGQYPDPKSNTKRCFPVRWAMPPATYLENHWFHKYVVAQLVEDDGVADGPNVVTRYEYVGSPAWAYHDNPFQKPDQRTWSQWRGYQKVRVRKGDPANEPGKPESLTEYLYFRGMDGDRRHSGDTTPVTVRDSQGVTWVDTEQLSGFVRETITYNGVGAAVVSSEIHDPFSRQTAATGNVKAFQVEVARTMTRTPIGSGSHRTTQVDTEYDAYGNPTKVDDRGDTSDLTDNTCTTTTYTSNTTAWILNLAQEVKTVAGQCGSNLSYPDDAISLSRNYYDGGAWGATPTKGDLTKVEVASSYDATGKPTSFVTTSTGYDAYGRSTSVTDPLQRTTLTRYTETNGLTTSTTVTNPRGHAVTTTVNPARGHPVTVTDANGGVTTMRYDALGRMTRVYRPGRSPDNGDTPNLRFTYQVSSTGSWIRTETLKAKGMVSTYQIFDGFLRPRQTQAPSPNGGRVLTDTLYDSRGLAMVTRAPYYNKDAPGGTLFVALDPDQIPNATVTVFDGAGRPTASVYYENNVEKWRTRTYYDGDRVSVVPPRGGTATTTITDARGRTTALWQYRTRPADGPPTGEHDVTTYDYTPRGELASVTDAAGNVWRYRYDVLGRKVRADDPDRGATTMTYDDAGQLRTATDARGRTVVTRYDILGRKLETRLGSDTGTRLTAYTYDTATNGVGHLATATRDPDGNPYTSRINSYDIGGQVTSASVVIPAVEGDLAGTYTTSNTYKPDGSPATTSLPALGDLPAETLTYDYDNLGLRDSLTGAIPYINDTTYTELAEPQRVALGDDGGTGPGKQVWHTYKYELGTRRLTEVVTDRELLDNIVVHNTSYSYDDVGNVTTISNHIAGSSPDTQCFRYDYLRRTTDAWTATDACAAAPSTSVVGGPEPYWHSYDYDKTGNRTSWTRHGLGGTGDERTSYTYPDPGDGVARPHAVTSTTGGVTGSYGYDATGNMTSRPGPNGQQTLTSDEEGQLRSITAGTDTTSYLYDADGKQLIRRDPGKVTLYVGGGEVTLHTNTGAVRGTRYYDGIGVRAGSGFTWTLSDHHGTTVLGIDSEDLSTATARRTDLFGNPRGDTPAWAAGRGFVGGTTNRDTGLTRLGAREYDPALGRFISVDPIIDPMDPQQMNGYAYSNNNPATMTDPDGLKYFVDHDGRITAPPARGRTPSVMRRIQQQVRRWKPYYDGWRKQIRARKAAVARARHHDRDEQAAAARRRAAVRQQQLLNERIGGRQPYYSFTYDISDSRMGRYSYDQRYPLHATPAQAMEEMRRCFNCNFPIANAPGHFPAESEFMPLEACRPLGFCNAPVRAYPLPKGNGFYVVAQEGHMDAPGSVLTFEFSRNRRGTLQLTTTAYVDSTPIPGDLYKVGAERGWAIFARNLGENMVEHQCGGDEYC